MGLKGCVRKETQLDVSRINLAPKRVFAYITGSAKIILTASLDLNQHETHELIPHTFGQIPYLRLSYSKSSY